MTVISNFKCVMSYNGTSFQVISSATSATQVDLQVANTSGNIISATSTTAHIGGSILKLSNTNASSSTKGLEIELAGSGNYAQFTDSGVVQFSVDPSGGVRCKKSIVARTSNSSVPLTNSGVSYTNTGAGALISLSLPAGVTGTWYCFMVTNSNGIKIIPNGGETIQVGSSQSTPTTGYIEATAIGSVVTLVYDGSQWIAESHVRNWTVV